MRGRVWAALVIALAAAGGCGPSLRRAADVRGELAAAGIDEARASAPDLVASAYAAADEAGRAEEEGDLEAVADHATRARLDATAALAERDRATAERERIELEQRAIELEERALRDEAAAREVEADIAHRTAARAAREELLRAMERAEIDEAHPNRRRRVSITDDAEMRRAALAIRERARLLAAAAAAMGAPSSAVGRADDLATRSAETRTSQDALELAEQAHEAAREALGSARRARSGPTSEEIAAVVEAANEAELRVVRLERGLGIELERMFRGTTAQPVAGAQRRIERLASLLAAHPHGPVAIEVDVPGTGENATRLARQRGEWARGALVAAGVPGDRVAWREPETTMPSADPGDRLRAVLVAYVDPPASAGVLAPEGADGSARRARGR